MRRLLPIMALFLVALSAGAQTYGRLDFALTNAQGQAISGAQVNVYSQAGCGVATTGTQAALYSTASGTTLPQPLYTDGFGHAYAYALPGCVTVVYNSSSTGTQTFADQTVTTPGGVYCQLSGCTLSGPVTAPAIYPSSASSIIVDPRAYGALCTGSPANASVDTTGIKSAITYINTQPAQNITLTVPGTCMIDASQGLTNFIVTSNNVTVQGPGTLRLKIPGTPYNQSYAVASGSLVYFWFLEMSGSNATVSRVTFDANGQAVTNCGGTYGCFWVDGIYATPAPQNLKITDNNFPDIGGWPVLTGGSHTLIKGNYASSSAGMVCANGATDCNIINNISIDSIDAPYAVNGGSTTPGYVSHFVISGNIATGTSVTTPNGNGIDVTAATDGVITNNIISGQASACIMVNMTGGQYSEGAAGTYLPSLRISVTGNNCSNNNTWGGWPANGEIVVGNYYSGNGATLFTPGDTANDVLVANNTITAYNPLSNDYGVVVGYGAKNVKVSGNYFYGCGTAASGTCGVTPYRIFDMGESASLKYISNHQDAAYAGIIRTQSAGPYEIWGNDMVWNAVSGSPTSLPFKLNGDIQNNGNIILPLQVTTYHGATGTQVQLSDGSGTSGNCVKYDANGNVTDAGAPCGAGGGGGVTYTTPTLNLIPKVTNATAPGTLGNSSITDDGTNVSTPEPICIGACASAVQFSSGSSLPGTCTVGDMFFLTSAT